MNSCKFCGSGIHGIVEGVADTGWMLLKYRGRWMRFRGNACDMHAQLGVKHERTDAAERAWNRKTITEYPLLEV